MKINQRRLKEIATGFKDFIRTEGQQWQEERDEEKRFLEEHFSITARDKVNGGILKQLIHQIWSFRFAGVLFGAVVTAPSAVKYPVFDGNRPQDLLPRGVGPANRR